MAFKPAYVPYPFSLEEMMVAFEWQRYLMKLKTGNTTMQMMVEGQTGLNIILNRVDRIIRILAV